MTPKPIIIVQGGQYGSEAKGAIAAYLCNRRPVNVAVRTGATNAGHTVYVDDPHGGDHPIQFKMQQLPVGFVNRNTKLVLGAGALIDPEILDKEVALIKTQLGEDVRDRLMIDRRAGLHVPAHAARSKASGRHHGIGATGKGCSEALIDRIRNRGTQDALLFGDSPYASGYDVGDTEKFLNDSYDEGAQILLEGTQGQLLDLYLGPYPYTTHKQTGPAQWMLEAGLSPALKTEIVMVIRTYPIRVAGNSGPLPDETTWSLLAREINFRRIGKGLPPLVNPDAVAAFDQALREVGRRDDDSHAPDPTGQHLWTTAERSVYREAISELNKWALAKLDEPTVRELSKLFEMTTVTRKMRRIAYLHEQSLRDSVRQIRPTWVALTFMNYVFPEQWNAVPTELTREMRHFVIGVESVCRAPVTMTSWGPEERHIMDHRYWA